MAYIAATLNPEILKNFQGPVRVGKKKSGSGRVAGTRQGLVTLSTAMALDIITPQTIVCVRRGKKRDERINEQGDSRSRVEGPEVVVATGTIKLILC